MVGHLVAHRAEQQTGEPAEPPGADDPNRISAGTFHPDAEGRSEVSFTAAVDPTVYPTIVVTAEPGDGDPRPSEVEVLPADLELQ